MIADKDLNELIELKKEIEDNLAADRSFALELQYWSNVLKKIEERVAIIRVQTIYTDYMSQNKEQIDADIKLAIKRKSALIKDKDLSKNY
jgi:Conserved mid region of cactin